MRRISSIILFLALALLAGCRGQTSERPPIHLNPNMDDQPRIKAQSENSFFADRRGMRTPPQGTMAFDRPARLTVFHTGQLEDGSWVNENPAFEPADYQQRLQILERGRERFEIFCSICHDRAGTGQGIVMPGGPGQYQGFPPPPSFHDDRIRQMADGELYAIISNGVRNMPPYRQKIGEADRWAIVAYVRALQRSQRTTLEDVPPQLRRQLDVQP